MQVNLWKSGKMFARLEEMNLDLDALLKDTAIKMLLKDFHTDHHINSVKAGLKQTIFKVINGTLVELPCFSDWRKDTFNNLDLIDDPLAKNAYYDLIFTFQRVSWEGVPYIKDGNKDIPQLGTDLDEIQYLSRDSILIVLGDIKKELKRLNDTINDKLTEHGSQADRKGK